MSQYEEKLKKFLQDRDIKAAHIHFDKIVHTVKDACEAVNAQPDDIVKTICMVANDGNKIISAIVLGSYRVSASRASKAIGIERLNIATPRQVLEKTGYPVGGTPPFGYEATFIVDPLVMEKDIVYVGGGAPSALVKISTKELLRVNKGNIARVRE